MVAKNAPATNVRCISKQSLRRINNNSTRLGYNRTINPAAIETLPDDKIYIVTPVMVHEHIAGKLAEPHMRCSVYAGPTADFMMLDISFVFFNALPRVSDIEALDTTEETDSEAGE